MVPVQAPTESTVHMQLTTALTNNAKGIWIVSAQKNSTIENTHVHKLPTGWTFIGPEVMRTWSMCQGLLDSNTFAMWANLFSGLILTFTCEVLWRSRFGFPGRRRRFLLQIRQQHMCFGFNICPKVVLFVYFYALHGNCPLLLDFQSLVASLLCKTSCLSYATQINLQAQKREEPRHELTSAQTDVDPHSTPYPWPYFPRPWIAIINRESDHQTSKDKSEQVFCEIY